MNKFEFKNLTPFKWFVLENFPFIEADFDALTEWQLFCKIGKEMNKIINSENSLGTQVENVTNAFIELQKYVNNYFDNLDVQEEINNKLNEMAQDGTLEEIISNYLEINGILSFNTVNDMQNATNLTNGSSVQTFGFYTLNDGGGAKYKIRTKTNEDTIDNKFIISLNDNTLIAELIYNNEINTLQIGLINDNTEDISQTINNIISNNAKIQKINFNKGNYKVSNTININRKITLNLNNSILKFDGSNYLFNINTRYNNKPTIKNRNYNRNK